MSHSDKSKDESEQTVVVVGGHGGMSSRYRDVAKKLGWSVKHYEQRLPPGLRHSIGKIGLVVVMVGISVLAAWGSTVEAVDPGSSMNTAQLLSAGYQVAQLAVAVLGVLTITGEYSTGMIRSTLVAVPRRVPVLTAKALVLSSVSALRAAIEEHSEHST